MKFISIPLRFKVDSSLSKDHIRFDSDAVLGGYRFIAHTVATTAQAKSLAEYGINSAKSQMCTAPSNRRA